MNKWSAGTSCEDGGHRSPFVHHFDKGLNRVEELGGEIKGNGVNFQDSWNGDLIIPHTLSHTHTERQ